MSQRPTFHRAYAIDCDETINNPKRFGALLLNQKEINKILNVPRKAAAARNIRKSLHDSFDFAQDKLFRQLKIVV